MSVDIVVVNGGSSSGKTSMARCLQQLLLPRIWLRWSIDDFVEALPASKGNEQEMIEFGSGGTVQVGPAFRKAEAAWVAGIAATAREGVGVILDDVFLGGSASQQRLSSGLSGLQPLWVGVRCDREVAAARESRRADRVAGMAAAQAQVVHRGVHYDIEVDSTAASPMACARRVLSVLEAHSE